MGSFVNEHALVSFLGSVSFHLLHVSFIPQVFYDVIMNFLHPIMVALSAVLTSSSLVVNVADDSLNHREELILVHLARFVGMLFENLYDFFFIILIHDALEA